MNISTVFGHGVEAADIRVHEPVDEPGAGPSRCLMVGPVGLIFAADSENPRAWMDVATALSALSAAADDLWAWAIREAEKASDLRTTREMLAAQRRTDDFNLPEPQELSAS